MPTQAPLAESLKLLEFERQTWQLACEKLGADSNTAAPTAPRLRSFDATGSRGEVRAFSLAGLVPTARSAWAITSRGARRVHLSCGYLLPHEEPRP